MLNAFFGFTHLLPPLNSARICPLLISRSLFARCLATLFNVRRASASMGNFIFLREYKFPQLLHASFLPILTHLPLHSRQSPIFSVPE